MPCVRLHTCYLKEILHSLPELPPCNWLISGLDCYDYCGWEGCEKWAAEDLFLSDAQFRHDVDLRDMQFIWGVFSAIPADLSKEEIDRYPLPETEVSCYMSNHISPQHPLALLEFYLEDGGSVYVSSKKRSLLEPLYTLPYEPEDQEAGNRSMNAKLRRIQDILRQEVPGVSMELANAVQWQVYRNCNDFMSDTELKRSVMHAYHIKRLSGKPKWQTIWDPYLQE